jgi:hypothetical protein
MNSQALNVPADVDPAMAELEATRFVYEKLKPLSPEAQRRVFQHVSGLLALKSDRQPQDTQGVAEEQNEAILHEQEVAPKYDSFADLANAAGPKTHAEKALVAGYWLQVCQNAKTFDGFTANKELKQLGKGMRNITAAINALRNERPALALQVGKSGQSQQSRKTYKLSVDGIKAVEAMING